MACRPIPVAFIALAPPPASRSPTLPCRRRSKSALDAATLLYAAARGGERLITHAAEAERLSARQTSAAGPKP